MVGGERNRRKLDDTKQLLERQILDGTPIKSCLTKITTFVACTHK